MTSERIKWKPWLKYGAYLLPAIPIIIYGLFWMWRRNYWFTADPAAVYFLDSLAVFAGKTYVYVDHPGTPVSILGSILLGLTYPFFGSRETLIRYYLAEPETFFTLTNLFLLAANLLTVVIFYRTASSSLKQDKMLAGIALSLMYFGIHPSGFSALTYWTHNSFSFIFGTLWLLWLYNELQAPRELERKKIILLGVAVGAIVTTTLYLLPWLVGGVLTIFIYTLRRDKPLKQAILNALIMAGGGLLGILILLAPIYLELSRLLSWMSRLIGRNGLYGSGQAGLYSPGMITASLKFWWQTLPLVMVALTLALVALGYIAWRVKSRKLERIAAGDFALAIGLLSQTLILILVLSKMFYRTRYILSLAAILPVLFLLAVKLSEQVDWKAIVIKRGIYAGLIVSTLFFMYTEIASQQQRTTVERESAAAHALVVSKLAKTKGVPPKDLVIVYAFGTPFKCASLLLASDWVPTFDKEISAQCPNQYAIFDVAFDVELNTPEPVAPIEDIDWDLVVWPGNRSNLPEYLASVGGENVPKSWHIKRGKWFYVRANDLQK